MSLTNESFHRVFDHLSAGVVLLDDRRRIIAANPGYVQMAGLREGDVLGEDCGRCHRCWDYRDGKADLCRERCPFDQPDLEEKPVPVLLDVRGARRGVVQRAYSRQYDADGRLTGILVFFFPLGELDRLDRELRMASEVQSELLQLRRDPTPGWEVALASRPYRPVGGDLAETSRRVLYVADVSSKSMPAALTLKTVSRAFRSELRGDPEKAMDRLNRRLVASMPSTMFVAAVAVFVRPGNRLDVVHAGLELPWLYEAATGKARPLSPPGLVLGVEAPAMHRAVSVEMHPGDVLAVWSDGFGEALLGAEQRPPQIMRRLAGAKAGMLQPIAERELLRHLPGDDATLLAVRLEE